MASSETTLDACDIAGIEETVAGTLDTTATWLRPDRSPDDMGGQNTTWREVDDDLPCRLNAQRLRYEVVQDRVVTITAADVTAARDTALQMGDRLVIDGNVWHVDGVPVTKRGALSVGVTLVRP